MPLGKKKDDFESEGDRNNRLSPTLFVFYLLYLLGILSIKGFTPKVHKIKLSKKRRFFKALLLRHELLCPTSY